jgi:hypothetical protein
MSKGRYFGLASAFALMSAPLLASYSDLHIVGASVSNNQLAIAIQNPSAYPETARIHASVLFTDGTAAFLESSNFTVAANSTATVSLTTSHTIAGITENPEPIPTTP